MTSVEELLAIPMLQPDQITDSRPAVMNYPPADLRAARLWDAV